MPAQGLFFILYVVLLSLVFPFSVVNYLIVKTSFLPSVKSFIVSSESMDPSLSEGSLVYTFKEKDYKNGDMVTFRDSIGTVAHRIVGEKMIGDTKYFVTKGDANTIVDDELVPATRIYGKVVTIVPWIGNAILIMKKFLV